MASNKTPKFPLQTRRVIPAFFILFQIGATCFASDQVGTLTSLSGRVQIYSHPSKTPPQNAPSGTLAKYEDQLYYRVRDAKIGDRLEKGNIVRAFPSGSTRIVFDNGDQYNIGPGTAFQVSWDKDTVHTNSKIDLMYGKLRGVVSKGGPRSHLRVVTKGAVMGVRGTDFFIASSGSSDPKDGGTEVSIIRGSVEVTPIRAQLQSSRPVKPIEVAAGFTATILPPPPPVTSATKQGNTPTSSASPNATIANPKGEPSGKPVITETHLPIEATLELRKTTKEDFVAIEKSSAISAKKTELPPAIAKLEQKAVETVMNDVKTHDPKLFEKLQNQKFDSTSQINSIAVEKLAKEAPKAPEKRKPFQSEIDDLEGDAYRRYFKDAE